MAMIAGWVILIEDDEGMREAIDSLLGAAGYTTACHASAENMLATGASRDARCVVTDLRLGAMSGFDLIDELRRRGPCPPVIAITAHDSPTVRAEALRRGVVAYLPKPFAGTELLAAVARAFDTCVGTPPMTCAGAGLRRDEGGHP